MCRACLGVSSISLPLSSRTFRLPLSSIRVTVAKVSCPDVQLFVIPSDADSLALRDGLLLRAVDPGIVGRGLQAGWAVGHKVILAGPDDDEVAAGIHRFNGSLGLGKQAMLRASFAVLDNIARFVIGCPTLLTKLLLSESDGGIYQVRRKPSCLL